MDTMAATAIVAAAIVTTGTVGMAVGTAITAAATATVAEVTAADMDTVVERITLAPAITAADITVAPAPDTTVADTTEVVDTTAAITVVAQPLEVPTTAATLGLEREQVRPQHPASGHLQRLRIFARLPAPDRPRDPWRRVRQAEMERAAYGISGDISAQDSRT